ncbi:hypothetical protein V865_006408 [Kwoniella europaea PYCC6329]|uniref:Uncharacterized protein n=1 Tax=Kwoniella europaea PYCC6329 TaxID=1423913 RepID=A0AAX4KPE0_9TREE
MYDFYNSSGDNEPYDDSSPTPPVEATVDAPQWLSIESQQKTVFASLELINAESKHLADTLWNEKVGQYSQNISDGLTEARYNSLKSDEVQAIPDIRKAISGSHSGDSADSQRSRREIHSMSQEMISQNQAAETCDESMMIRSERIIHSIELGNYILDISVKRGEVQNRSSRVTIQPLDKPQYPEISPVQRWVFDTPLKDESVVQRLAENGYDSRGWPTGGEGLGERAGGIHQAGSSRRMISTSVRFE